MSKIPLNIPNLSGNEAKYLQDCVETNFVSSSGRFVSKLEEMVAQISGCPDIVATSAGTTALHLALVTLGVKPGDLVIVPSLTFIASANAISHAGAQPWIFDIEPENWCLDPAFLKATLEDETALIDGICTHKDTGKPVTAIMPVHPLGIPCDIDPMLAIAQDYNLKTIMDGAAALGALYKGRKIADNNADATAFSFNGNKTFTAGGGGAIAFQNPEHAAHAKHLSTQARSGNGYEHTHIGYNYRMTNIEAALGCAQLEQCEVFLSKKRKIQATYAENLTDLQPFPAPPWGESACWFSGFVCEVGQGQAYLDGLDEAGIESRAFWTPLYLQKPYANCPKTSQDNAEDIWARIIMLPSSTGISDTELETVIKVVQDIRGRLS